jgi:hypothetical protein
VFLIIVSVTVNLILRQFRYLHDQKGEIAWLGSKIPSSQARAKLSIMDMLPLVLLKLLTVGTNVTQAAEECNPGTTLICVYGGDGTKVDNLQD